MIYELMLLGTLWFWLLFAVVTIAAIALIHNRCESAGIFFVVLFLLAWLLVGDLAAIVIADPWRLVWCSLGYVGIGLLWCFPKWILLLDKIKRLYQSTSAEFGGKVSEERWSEWSQIIVCSSTFYDAGLSFNGKTGVLTPPQFANNKEHITGWAILWPWSVLDTLLSDIIKRLYEWIIELYKRMFQAISDWMFRGL